MMPSSDREIILDFHLPALKIEKRIITGGNCLEIFVDDFSQSGKPGAPSLPTTSVLMAAPPDAIINLDLIDPVVEQIILTNDICPVKMVTEEFNNENIEFDIRETYEKIQQYYILDMYEPENPAIVLQKGFMRSQSVAQIGIFPVQYNPVSGQLRLYKSFKLRATFPNHRISSDITKASVSEENSFELFLRANIINYEQGKNWRQMPSRDVQASSLLLNEEPGYKFIVEKEGIYEVTYNDLKSVGVPVDLIDPRFLHLTQAGKEVSIIVTGEQIGRFDPGDSIRFYGWPAQTIFSEPNIYLLKWNQIEGLRIIPKTLQETGTISSPAYFWDEKIHDQNLLYIGNHPNGNKKDHWYQNYILSPNASYSKASYTININPVNGLSEDRTAQATLYGLFRGLSASPQHHIKITLNGDEILDNFYDAKGDILIEAKFHPSHLVTGANTLEVESLIDNGITSSVFYVNWFKVQYPALFHTDTDRLVFTSQPGNWLMKITGFSSDLLDLFDITDPHNPQELKAFLVQQEGEDYSAIYEFSSTDPKRFLIHTRASRLSLTDNSDAPLILPLSSENLMSDTIGADYVIITPDIFRFQAENLATYRTGLGLRTRVVDIQAIYDNFGYGFPDPIAVQNFIRYTFQNWQPPAPLYVLLFGDGNYDYRNYLARNESDFIPPLLGEFDPWVGETPSDNAYVSIWGQDNLPDLFVGRIPVKTQDEAEAAIRKITTYEGTAVGEWVKQATFIADNPDSGGDFRTSSDMLANLLPGQYTSNKVYLGVAPNSTASLAKSAIKSNLNAGRGLSIYSGHGAPFNWANEKIFESIDVSTLSATTQFPLSVSLDCSDGYFIVPSSITSDNSSLSELFIRPADRGAIAVFAPAGWGIVQDHDILARGLFEAIFTQGLNTAGAATTYAKIYLAAHAGGYNSLIDTYILFGDPALQLKLGPSTPPQPGDLGIDLQSDMVGDVQPGDTVEFTLKYKNLGSSYLQQVVVSSDLPVGLTNVTALDTPDIARHSVQPNTWLITSLAPGATGQISFTGQVADGFTGELRVSALGTTTSTEADLFNNNDALAWQGPQTPHRMYYLPLISQEKP